MQYYIAKTVSEGFPATVAPAALDPLGCLTALLTKGSSFGGQRSIQLSYGRLLASIDETPASGNALPQCKKPRFSVFPGITALSRRARIS